MLVLQSESLRLPESGARPSFEISVEDPQKVGDAINAYIVYRVKTKVRKKLPSLSSRVLTVI